MFCDSVEENMTTHRQTLGCRSVWPNWITVTSHTSWRTDSIWCSVWHVTRRLPVYISLHLICEISHVPDVQHLSGHVLTINYSSVPMKWGPRKKRRSQTRAGMFPAENVLLISVMFELQTQFMCPPVVWTLWRQQLLGVWTSTNTGISGLRQCFGPCFHPKIRSLTHEKISLFSKNMRIK